MAPNIPKLNSMAVTFTAVKPRWRNSRMFNMGCEDRSSQTTNPASAAAPTRKEASTEVLVQPWLLPRTSPKTIPNRPALTRATPARSRRVGAPLDSLSFHRASGMRAIPTGTLSQKMYCHDQPLVTAPPTRGPRATAAPPMAPQMPRAKLRRSGGTAALSSVNERGMIIAPPAPWTARAMTRIEMLGARAATADAPVNTAIPRTKIRRRPKRSPMAAAESSSTANVKVYAFTVHSRPESPAWRWTRITGRAVDTTRLSNEAMKSARPVMTMAHTARDLMAPAAAWVGVPSDPSVAASGTAATSGLPFRPDLREPSTSDIRESTPWTGDDPDTVLHRLVCDWSLPTRGKKSGVVKG